MSFITENWQFILGCVAAIAVGVILIIMYRKHKITEEYLRVLSDYLDTIDDGEGIIPILASYARRAVLAVEQMVKAGVLEKTNEGRKNMAEQIVVELAASDRLELDEKDKIAIESLIEAEVYEMRRQ